MTCSPSFNGEPRQEGSAQCDHHCFYWKACLKELKLPEDYKLRNWTEIDATKKEIKQGKYHKNISYDINRIKPIVKYKKWIIS
jgi:hypothetical protein